MSDYTYINEYEREETQKYEGVYTPEEINLNKKLNEACTKGGFDRRRKYRAPQTGHRHYNSYRQ